MAKFDETPIVKEPSDSDTSRLRRFGRRRPGLVTVPALREGASEAVRCHPSKAKDALAIDIPPERLPDWQQRGIRRLGELLEHNKSLRVFMDACVRCGACADKCQFYLGTGDPHNMPVARAELLRAVYRRYFTLPGRLFPQAANGAELDEAMLNQWYTYFYQCSECRRCAVFCPFGIDTAEITAAAREIMCAMGVTTKYVTEVVAKVYQQGNNLGIPPAAWKNNCEFLEEDVLEQTGAPIKFPVDDHGAEVLLVPPSADNFANTDTMIGYAKLFHVLGTRWTTSTYCNEAGNFGLFLNHENLRKVNKRIVDAADRLGVKTIIWGECGHAWRAGIYTAALNGPLDRFDPPYPYHISQYIVDRLRKGALNGKIDRSANDAYVVTYHDPCNPARAGQLIDEPREILRACVSKFVEMPAGTIRERTFCCGGGGGLLTDELMAVRMAGGKPRALAVKQTGANFLATICAVCKAQLPESLKYWGATAQVGGVVELLGNALKL